MDMISGLLLGGTKKYRDSVIAPANSSRSNIATYLPLSIDPHASTSMMALGCKVVDDVGH
jgi:hypothetical protein